MNTQFLDASYQTLLLEREVEGILKICVYWHGYEKNVADILLKSYIHN